MIKRILGIVLVLSVLAIAANDAYRYIATQRRLGDTTYALAKWAGENASTMSREGAAIQLDQMAVPRGVRVYQYNQGDQGVQVWTSANVTGTLAVGTVAGLIAGKTIRTAFRTPFEIRDYRQTNYQ